MVDLYGLHQSIKTEVDNAIKEVIELSDFINGRAVTHFAEELASYLDIAHVVTCASGTDALQLALIALELTPGDEVIVPAFAYVAAAEAVAFLGLTPVFADVDPGTFLLAAEEVEKHLTPKTKAIIPVHLFGQCADMEALMALAHKHRLYVIEDAAQALGANFNFSDGTVKKAGTIGHLGTTSFFPSKNLGCFGDGGALFAHDDALALRSTSIANHGQRSKYHHHLVGVNSRLDSIQAAVLRVKLPHLDQYNALRTHAASFYDKELCQQRNLIIPARFAASTHVFHQYTIKCLGNTREPLRAYLRSKGIPSMVYYPLPMNKQDAYRVYSKNQAAYPVSEELTDQVLSLPIHTQQQEKELVYITETIKDYFREKDRNYGVL